MSYPVPLAKSKWKSEVIVKPKKKIGLVMEVDPINKAQLKKEALPPWLTPISFKPPGSKKNSIELTDFLSFSDKYRIKSKYFSSPSVSKIKEVFRDSEKKNIEQKNKKYFRSLIKMTTSEYNAALSSREKKNLNDLLKIDNFKSKIVSLPSLKVKKK